jgi:hypothetical protein
MANKALHRTLDSAGELGRWASRRDICLTSAQCDPGKRRDNDEEDLYRKFFGGEEDS